MQATNKSDATQVYEGAVKSSRIGAKGTLKYILKPLAIFGYHYFIEGIRAVQKDGLTKELEKITNLSYEETIKVMEKCQQDGVRVVATERTLEKENSHLHKIIDKFYETVDKFIVWICNKFGIGESKQLIKDFEKQTNTFIDPVKQLECEEREKECDLEL